MSIASSRRDDNGGGKVVDRQDVVLLALSLSSTFGEQFFG